MVFCLELKPWILKFKKDWDKFFKKFDFDTQKRILNKLEQMKQPLQSRDLTSSEFKVEEVGQYRIVFIEDKKTNIKHIHFLGNHKQYEEWFKKQ